MRSPLVAWLLAAVGCFSPASAGVPSYLSIEKYSISLTMDLDNQTDFTFQGQAVLYIRVNDQVPQGEDKFVLNGAGLIPTGAIIKYPNNRTTSVLASEIQEDKKEETLTIPGKDFLEKGGLYQLNITYNGAMNGTGGLFRSKLENYTYIGSHLYPTFSRRVFPCLDQPGNVADIGLTLTISYSTSENPVVLSGLTQLSSKKTDKQLIAKYISEVKMPASATFFTAGTYVTDNGNYWYPPYQKSDFPQAVLDIPTVKQMFNVTLDINPKLVVIPGLPVHSESGFRMTALSWDLSQDEAASTTQSKRMKAVQILRAVVKSLIAPVVPPKNWTDLWLVESIPLYIAATTYTELDRFKDWSNMNLLTVSDALYDTWSDDSMPVRCQLNSTNIMDYINGPTVSKGASILGMMVDLTSKNFNDFFISYLTKRKGNAVSTEEFLADFAEYLNVSSVLPQGHTLEDLMAPWLNKTGYPSLTLQRKDQSTVTAKEGKFGSEDPSTNWMIPIHFNKVSTASSLNAAQDPQLVWMNPSSSNNQLELASKLDANTTVLVNVKGPGLYRTVYDLQDLMILMETISTDVDSVPPGVLATILDDCIVFANKGVLNYTVVIDMLKVVAKNTTSDHLEPWLVIGQGLKEMWTYLYFTDLKERFEVVAADLLFPIYHKIGLGLDDPDMKRGVLRRMVVDQLCDYGDYTCLVDIGLAYDKKDTYTYIAPDMKSVLYCNGLRQANITVLNDVMASNYKSSLPVDVKGDILSYLACAQDNVTISSFLKEILLDNGEGLEGGELAEAFIEVAARPEHLDTSFSFLAANFDKLHRSLSDWHKVQMILFLGEMGSTDSQLKTLGNLKPATGNSDILSALSTALASIQQRKKTMDNNYSDIQLGLYGFHPTGPTSTTTTTSTTLSPDQNSTTPNPTPPGNGGGATAAAALLVLAASALALRL